MTDLTAVEIQALARAAGVSIPPHLITEVGYSLNAWLEALEAIDPPGLDRVEALPIVIPPASGPGGS